MEYRVFICHSYWHRKIYFELIQKLNDAGRFRWRNASVQYDMRFGDGDEDLDDADLRAEIRNRIESCDVFLVLTKPIASRRRWLQYEILLAEELGKPIIGIARRLNDKVSSFVRQHAIDIVDTWRIDHIVNAIQHYGTEYRHRPNIPAVVPASLGLLPDDGADIELEPEPTPAPLPSPARALPPHLAQSPRQVLYRAIAERQVEADIPLLREPVWWRAPGRSI